MNEQILYAKIRNQIYNNLQFYFSSLVINKDDNFSKVININSLSISEIIIPSCGAYDRNNTMLFFYDILFSKEYANYFIIVPDRYKIIELLILNKKQFIWHDYHYSNTLNRLTNGLNICFNKHSDYYLNIPYNAIINCIFQRNSYFKNLHK